jgi:4'-phosphopantetheinyl transferase
MILILYTEIRERMSKHRFQELLALLPEEMQIKIGRYVKWEDAEASLLGKALIIEALNSRNVNGRELIHEVKYNYYDRPYLPGYADFNISHSGNYVVCAASSQYQVGIDIERMRHLQLAYFKSYMTSSEWEHINRAPSPTRHFFHFWTRKEAIAKACGKGLSIPLTEIRLADNEALLGQSVWYLKEVKLSADYVCYLATNAKLADRDLVIQEVLF